MTWTITCGGSVVTLPSAPNAINEVNPVQIEESGTDNGGVVLISRFRKARRFTMKGVLTAANNSTAESSYLSPLRVMAGKAVTIGAPDSQFSGTWIMSQPAFDRVASGTGIRYTYTIEFMLGTTIVVQIA